MIINWLGADAHTLLILEWDKNLSHRLSFGLFRFAMANADFASSYGRTVILDEVFAIFWSFNTFSKKCYWESEIF